MIIYCLSMPSFLSHRKCSELKWFHFWVPDKCSVTKHTPARVWGEVLGGFFAHEVNVCLLERTLIQWSDLPCTSLQKLPSVCDVKMWCSFLVLKGFWSFRIAKIKHRCFSHPSDQAFHSNSFSEKCWNQGMLEPRNASILIQHFITTPQISPGLFQGKLECFLKAGQTFLCLPLHSAQQWADHPQSGCWFCFGRRNPQSQSQNHPALQESEEKAFRQSQTTDFMALKINKNIVFQADRMEISGGKNYSMFSTRR